MKKYLRTYIVTKKYTHESPKLVFTFKNIHVCRTCLENNKLLLLLSSCHESFVRLAEVLFIYLLNLSLSITGIFYVINQLGRANFSVHMYIKTVKTNKYVISKNIMMKYTFEY